jgi:DnaJ-domain-containing protein 1
MATTEDVEAAAHQAAVRLEHLRAESLTQVACVEEWWRRNYARVGHKRLGRLLLGTSPYTRREADTEGDPETEVAIEQASEELAALRRSEPTAVGILAQWWREYYAVAGHRRLGRSLIGTPSRTGGQRWDPTDSRNRDGQHGDGTAAEPIRDPWQVLGIELGASQQEIKTAQRRLAAQYHPDKVAHLAPEFRELAERRMKEINAAYDELCPRDQEGQYGSE